MAGRVFLRGLEADKYNLREAREERLSAPRVKHALAGSWGEGVGHEDSSPTSRAKWIFAPGDDPFLTQTVQSHFVEIAPGGANGGHGHQNEAAFYILEGRGYEIHDAKRYEWQQGDLVVVNADSRHQHFNADPERKALCLVVKPKTTWMLLGLTQQGKGSTILAGREADFGPREDWSGLWTPGVERLPKVIKGSERPWESTRDGRVKHLANAAISARLFGMDVYLQEIAAGSRSAKHWHMADELLYVVAGSGHTLQWRVEADIDDRYYARVAKTPERFEWAATDMIYVPQNTIHQHFAAPGAPVTLLSAQNRLFKLLGYDAVRYLEDAPESHAAAGERMRAQ
jgi:quercetin dioxygenase-like cupin family protein